MPNSPHETLLCRYHYDPLDRQSGCTLPQQPVIQRFHCDGRLTTEIQGGTRWSILQHSDHLLAQRNHREASVTATLLATDQQRSVLNALDATGPHPRAYSPYGHHPAVDRLLSLRGFNSEQPDPLTGHYHLGNGYRQFNPVLMRFNSPDNWSPFGQGGLNAYGYCEGDPVNRNDPTGHTWRPLKYLLRKIGVMRKPVKPKNVVQIGAWEPVPGNPELVRPITVASKKKTAGKTMLTKSEEEKFRRDLDKAVLEGRAAGGNLSTQKPVTSHQAIQHSTTTSNDSAMQDALEYMSPPELTALKSSARSWRKVGTERGDVLNAVKREEKIRRLNIHGNPPVSNRSIRRGEPGFHSS